MSRRAYCRCVVIQNWDYDEAAAKLKCFRRWLENNISRIPHQKIGGSVAFCDCELALIQAMCSFLPPDLPDGVLPETKETAAEPVRTGRVPALAAIRPAQGRRARAAL